MSSWPKIWFDHHIGIAYDTLCLKGGDRLLFLSLGGFDGHVGSHVLGGWELECLGADYRWVHHWHTIPLA